MMNIVYYPCVFQNEQFKSSPPSSKLTEASNTVSMSPSRTTTTMEVAIEIKRSPARKPSQQVPTTLVIPKIYIAEIFNGV